MFASWVTFALLLGTFCAGKTTIFSFISWHDTATALEMIRLNTTRLPFKNITMK